MQQVCMVLYWVSFRLVLDFYRSETGQRIVIYIKKLYNNYSDFCSTRNLKELMERGNHMVPSLFIWIFQEYPESAGRFFRRQLISCFLTGYSLKTGVRVTKYFRKHRLTPEDMV
ncbi:hypothetical protein RhiirC2_810630 [Rhizophagus irregularis]|uniref:Uncharacterized protein n=1 Tax=Rhizophagus irregularis TaxID=588596 RepID=A0A2N1NTN7_9GLOM|nr:hypothetical protein RhiirC2_810630 [Rhizophagus irregularis]